MTHGMMLYHNSTNQQFHIDPAEHFTRMPEIAPVCVIYAACLVSNPVASATANILSGDIIWMNLPTAMQ